VANRADVDVGLGTREFFFTHMHRSEIKRLTNYLKLRCCKPFATPLTGAHCGNRTRDLSLTKGVLYH
jgi:hypothetical protein